MAQVYYCTHRMIQEESSIFFYAIVLAIVRKKTVHMNLCLILNEERSIFFYVIVLVIVRKKKFA